MKKPNWAEWNALRKSSQAQSNQPLPMLAFPVELYSFGFLVMDGTLLVLRLLQVIRFDNLRKCGQKYSICRKHVDPSKGVLRRPTRENQGSIFMIQRIIWTIGVMCQVVAFSGTLFGQQTIVNVPSDALTPQGRSFYLHESIFTPNSANASYATTNFLTYGYSKNTELCATFYNFDDVGSEFGSVGLGYKSVYKLLEEERPDLELKWTHGFMMPVRLTGGEQAVGYFPYSHVAFNVPNTPMRLLGGAAIGSENLFGESGASALAGLEFPITEKLSFTGEWFSGNHNLSALIPGLTWHTEDLIIVGGPKIPNNFDRNEIGLVLEMGIFWGGKSGGPYNMPHYGVYPR